MRANPLLEQGGPIFLVSLPAWDSRLQNSDETRLEKPSIVSLRTKFTRTASPQGRVKLPPLRASWHVKRAAALTMISLAGLKTPRPAQRERSTSATARAQRAGVGGKGAGPEVPEGGSEAGEGMSRLMLKDSAARPGGGTGMRAYS